jgi:5-methylcytosine-specific restriction endonuclease McrA
MDERFLKMARAWHSAGQQYGIIANGFRDVGEVERAAIFEILFTESPEEWGGACGRLFKYAPDTVDLDRSLQAAHCPNYQDDCDCFLPDHQGPIRCQRERAAQLEIQKKRDKVQEKQWRSAVFDRDDYTCQKCKKRGGDLQAHHIKAYAKYPALRWVVSNGTTLCKTPCHVEAHQ